ncbi:GxxExxY protein [bacterium]|nr:GxxExxY protein [bacterium]
MVNQKEPKTYSIIGAAMEVHKELGCGFLESVYQEVLSKELATREIPFKREVKLPIVYKGEKICKHYKADFVCYDEIIVEIKALEFTGKLVKAQVVNYLKATGFKVGLLLNFGKESLEYKRFIN